MGALTQQQIAAATSEAKNTIVVSTAGAGKTTVIMERVRWLVEKGVSPNAILLLTYTIAGAREIERRLGFRVGYAGTLHSFMLRLLNVYGSQYGYSKDKIVVLDEEEAKALQEKACKKVKFGGSQKDFRHAMRTVMEPKPSPSKADLAAKTYVTTNIANQCVCFDTILILGLDLLRNLPVQKLTTDGVTKLSHLLWDEVQDSASIDYRIMEALPVENRFLVGDDSQSVFAFRGASVEQMLRLSRSPDWTLLHLGRNFRSDKLICAAANNLIRHNKNRIDNPVEPASENDGTVTVKELESASVEAQAVAQEILSSGYPQEECCVLVRTNALAKFYRDALKAAGITVGQNLVRIPPDWARCVAGIQFLASPDNDHLAIKWLKIMQLDADKIAREAGENYQTINDYHFKGQPVDDVSLIIPALARFKVSKESLDLLGSLITSEGCQDMQDVLLALSKAREASKESRGVHVGTIHSWKGRESKLVCLPAFEEGVISMDGEGLEELRRLAFVGITRAQHRLLITYVRQRTTPWGKLVDANPSRFVKELGL